MQLCGGMRNEQGTFLSTGAMYIYQTIFYNQKYALMILSCFEFETYYISYKCPNDLVISDF